jgi:C1A family cysteine protease
MMKVVVLCCLAATVLAITESEYQRQFLEFSTKFQKVYATDAMFTRYNIFKDNLDFIMAHNKRNETYTLGVNEFSDLSHAEFLSLYVGGFTPMLGSETHEETLTPSSTPNDIDWRGKATTPIKNQGSCGSCWAFGTTGGVEGAVAIKSGQTPVSLSEQQLVDCAGSSGNHGCNGGLPSLAYNWIKANGICDQASYPYTAKDGTCKKTCKPVARISGFTGVGKTDQAHVDAVTKQPLSIGIDASARGFQSYTKGVFSGPCGTQLNHAVLTVGYNKDAFIVKNSCSVGALLGEIKASSRWLETRTSVACSTW